MSLWSELRERARSLLFRSRQERELAEEMRFHLEMEVEKGLREGLDPEEARRRAHLAFGGVERHREGVREARGVGAVERVLRDLRLSIRRLLRDPGFTIPTLASIALGVGVATAVFALTHAVLLRPLPYPEPERLVALTHSATNAPFAVEGQSLGTYLYYRRENRVFEDIGTYLEREWTLTDSDGEAEQVRVTDVTPGLLTILRATPHLGRLLLEEDQRPGTDSGVIISYELWMRRYAGDPDIVGRRIELSREAHRVAGVMEPGFGFPHPDTQVWYTSWRPESTGGLGQFATNGVARLRPGISLEEAQADLDRMARRLPEVYPDFSESVPRETGFRAEVRPLKAELVGDDVSAALRLLLGAGAFLLLIAWANATNLCLARGDRRTMETGLSRALGARRSDLIRKFVTEAMLLATVGGAIGVALADAAVAVRFGFDLEAIPRLRDVRMGVEAFTVAGALILVTGLLLAGIAFVTAGRDSGLRSLMGTAGRTTAGARRQWSRRTLVAGQLALALVLLVGSGLMAGSFWRLTQVDLGFEPAGAIAFYLPTPPGAYGSDDGRYYHAQAEVHDQLLRAIRAVPGVQRAEAGNIAGFPLTPVAGFYRAPVAEARPTEPKATWPEAFFSFATPGYFEAMGIPIVRGRTFRPEDTSRDRHGVVLSRSLAGSLFADDDPIGRRVRWARRSDDPDYVVVGVAGDVPSEAIQDGPTPVMYFPNLYPPVADTITGVVHIFVPSNEMYVIRTNLRLGVVVPRIRAAIDRVDPKLVMTRIGTLEGLVEDSMASTRIVMLLLLIGAGTALSLGLIGVYGVLSYAVGQRTSELGVRIALGADPTRVVRMVVRQGATLALVGVVVGLPATFLLSRSLDALLFEISPNDPFALLGTAALLIVIALVASYLPARRAGSIDPARALRAE
jgi:putative ABC transport system permease protein